MVIFLGERMVRLFQEEMWTHSWFLDVRIHLQAQRIRIFGYLSTQPGKHVRKLYTLFFAIQL